MSALRRTSSGDFELSDAYTVERLEAMTLEERQSLVVPTEKLFLHLDECALPDFYAKLFIAGAPLYQKKLRTSLPVGKTVRVTNKGEFIGLGRADVLSESDDTPVLKAEKLFKLKL